MTYVNVVRNGRIVEIEIFCDHSKALELSAYRVAALASGISHPAPSR